MKRYPNIAPRKNRTRDSYTAWGGGHYWEVWRAGWKGWIASSDTATFIIKGRILGDISAKLSALSKEA